MKRFSFVLAILFIGLSHVNAAESKPGQPLRAEQKKDRISIYVNDKIFTEYLFEADSKYPHFFPVNGPHSARTITVRRTEPYPHHSSLFFGCDRVNGGNYWQEGLERGRIVSKAITWGQTSGDTITFENHCIWVRPKAESPFQDHRRITISAPSPEVRTIDFEITLEALIPVVIEKNNHSLFSARMAPDLAVTGGGVLSNSLGDRGEKQTFGRRAPWADYRGQRDGKTEGLAIFCHPENRWSPPPWFTRDYGFFSPTPMYWLENDRLDLKAGEKIHLRYRVVVHGNNPSAENLEALYKQWVKGKNSAE